MNDERKEELLTRWMDDVASNEDLRELEPVLAENPELHEEHADYVKLRDELKATLPAEVEPPYPDFFNSHLERLIRESNRAEKETSKAGGTRSWLWTLWMAPAAAAAIVAAFILGMNTAHPDSPGVVSAAGSEVYSPLTNVSTVVMPNEIPGATVLLVSGLERLADQDLVIGDGSNEGEHGLFVSTSEVY